MNFTKEQMKAIEFFEGPLLITAAPGAGKTQVFACRIAYLIRVHNVQPDNILALTYTTNAAKEMRSRLATLVGSEVAERVTMLTFHSFAIRSLKRYLPHRYADKKITPEWFRTRVLYDIAGEKTKNNVDGLALSMRGNELGMFISYQKSNLIQPGDQVIMNHKAHPFIVGESSARMSEAYESYCRLIRNSNTMDFDDMLLDFVYNMETNPTFASKITKKYQFVQVDEFQDTNAINTHILKLVNKNNLVVVGDVNQSIYSFINADINEIIDFNSNFPGSKLIRLNRNFRSTKNIVELTNKVAQSSPNEKLVKLSDQIAAREELGSRIPYTVYQTEEDETKNVVGEIEILLEEGHAPNEIAVISRTNANLGLFESEFATLKIPVNNANGGSFFDKKEIADLLAYAIHTIDKRDDMSMRRIFNAPNRFISKQAMNELDAFASERGLNIEDALDEFAGGRSGSAMRQVASLFNRLREKKDQNAASFLRIVYNLTQYEEHIYKTAKTSIDAANRIDSIEHLFTLAARFKSVSAFLTHISIIQNNSKGAKADAINLLTVHGSKGLEFQTVFGVGINEKSYPHDMSYNYEEERRLLYVCVSRAKDNLNLSSYAFERGKTIRSSPFMLDAFGEKVENVRKSIIRGHLVSSVILD